MHLLRAGIGGLGFWELLVVLGIVVLVFGVGKLPQLGTALGETLKNFKKANEDSDPKTPHE